jgi:GNAT superfamily N-acetyltransferase
MKEMNIEILLANYEDEQHGNDIGYLLNCYAMDSMGGGKELDPSIVRNIGRELSALSYAFSILCYVDDKPAGLVNCFDSFSTFNCKPLVNIHDIVVVQEYRGLGLSQKMLEKVEEIAKDKGCCKMTLEVLEGNKVARSAYEKFGFASYILDPRLGQALFWQKTL